MVTRHELPLGPFCLEGGEELTEPDGPPAVVPGQLPADALPEGVARRGVALVLHDGEVGEVPLLGLDGGEDLGLVAADGPQAALLPAGEVGDEGGETCLRQSAPDQRDVVEQARRRQEIPTS